MPMLNLSDFPTIEFTAARQETPEQTVRRCGDVLDHDIRDTVTKIYAPLNRQASDGVAFVVLALFLGTVALLAPIVAKWEF